MNSPLVSVITVVYNDVKNIERTIQSVLSQPQEWIEYIVIDGGSTDGTVDLIKQYDHLITAWISERDDGIYDAMNKGIALARGDGITFLNSGDSYEGSVFYEGMPLPEIMRVVVKNGASRSEQRLGDQRLGMPISHQGIIYRNTGEKYSLQYRIASDYEFSLRQGVFERLKTVPEASGYVLYDNTGYSAQNYWRRDWENLRIIYRYFGFTWALLFALTQLPKNLLRPLLV